MSSRNFHHTALTFGQSFGRRPCRRAVGLIATNTRQAPAAYCRSPRAGVILGIVLVCIAVALMLGGALTRAVMLHHRNVTLLGRQQQSLWLAESAIGRAVHALRDSRDYRGETWEVPAAILGGDAPGSVEIRVEEAAQALPGWEIHVVARYPHVPVHRVMYERHVFVPDSVVENDDGKPQP